MGEEVAPDPLLTPVREMRHRVTTHDSAVLMTFFDHCKGETWVCSSNWGSGEELSQWYNVSVSLPKTMKGNTPR